MNQHHANTGFNLASLAARINTFTVNVNDYEMITPTLARVVVSVSGEAQDAQTARAAIASLFKGQASPVEGSFRWATRNGDLKSAVGFVKANLEVRDMEETDANGRYKAMSSNLLMDNTDKSLWEIREGSAGAYLCRQGNEDLGELVSLACSYKSQLPKVAMIASAAPASKDFIAYIDRKTEEVKYGFVMASEGSKITVIAEEGAEEIDQDDMIEDMEFDDEELATLGMRDLATASMDRDAMIEYYKKLYSYNPEYVQMVIQTIDQHSFA